MFTQNTGPVRATYLSGQNVTMNILVNESLFIFLIWKESFHSKKL